MLILLESYMGISAVKNTNFSLPLHDLFKMATPNVGSLETRKIIKKISFLICIYGVCMYIFQQNEFDTLVN